MAEKTTSDQATMYKNNSKPQFVHGKQVVDRLLKPKAGQVILDLGCGTGELTMCIASQVGERGRVVGVDPDTARLKLAREEAQRRGLGNIAFFEGSAAEAPSHGPYDSMFSNLAAHWIPDDDWRADTGYLAACLKPGGHFAFSVLSDTSDFHKAYFKLVTGGDVASVLAWRLRPEEFYKDCFLSAGLLVELAYTQEVLSTKFANMDKYFDFIKAYTDGRVDPSQVSQKAIDELFREAGIDANAEYCSRPLYAVLVARKQAE